MRAIPIDQAIGQRLACDVTRVTSTDVSALLTRGTLIEPHHLPALRDAGHSVVFVMEEADGASERDAYEEDEAALSLAEALRGPGLSIRAVGSGRALFLARDDGLLLVDTAACTRVNESDLALLVTLPPSTMVRAGHIVAAVDMIPLRVERSAMADLRGCVADAPPVLAVRPVRASRVALLITGTEVYEGRVPDLVAPVVRAKVRQYGGEVTTVEIVPDDAEGIATALGRLAADHDVVIVTGGMSVDPTDHTPASIRRVASRVIKYGLPVLPNAMSMVAYRDAVPILGISSGIIYFAQENVLDWLLPFALSGEPITRESLVSAGAGGLRPAFVADVEARLPGGTHSSTKLQETARRHPAHPG